MLIKTTKSYSLKILDILENTFANIWIMYKTLANKPFQYIFAVLMNNK